MPGENNDFPRAEELMIRCNRTAEALEKGEVTPSVGNAIQNQASVMIRIVKLELDAAKLLNRTATLLPRFLG